MKPFHPFQLLFLSALATSLSASPVQQYPLQQPGSTSPVDYPFRPLPWGDINIVSTTDTHGWLLGHQRRENSYSGDWGDLLSFVTRLKNQSIARGVDFLLVDSGDRVDGNGLVDAEPAGHVKGYTALKYFKELPYDLITTGNHELYKYPVALNTYRELYQEGYGEKYVTSNVEIEINGTWVGMGERVRKFKTAMGRKVTAFGPLFFFRANDKGLRITPPHLMINTPWFQSAISVAPDFFLLVGHMSIQTEPDSEWSLVFQAIRKKHPRVPILIFGGHHHIRDCKMEDERSMSLAAGRYMETLGWMSVSGIDGEGPLKFERRYLDQNRNTYKYHAGEDFDTEAGAALTKAMTATATSFNLTQKFGTAPHSYYLYRYPPTHEYSILNLLTSKVLPRLIRRTDREKKGTKSFTVLNSGSVRFDIFEGDFTRNSQWIVLPFTNNFVFVPEVPYNVAKQLLRYLNKVGEHGTGLLPSSSSEEVYRENQVASYENYVEGQRETNRTWGYVTVDQCEGLGDDVLHKPLPGVRQPIFVASALPESEENPVDVVFFDFIRPDIIAALNVLQKKKTYTFDDVGLFLKEEEGKERLTANTLLQEYARVAWN